MKRIQSTDMIEINHGGGGKKMDELIAFITQFFTSEEDTDLISPTAMDDGAVISIDFQSMVMTTDSHTVYPVIFPGGTLGDLSIVGTVNDLVVMGAQPLYLSLGVIIEEGFTFGELEVILQSIKSRIDETGVRIICGDTKVMPKGTISSIVTNTAGVGKLVREEALADKKVKEGDKIIITGSIGDHGAAIMAKREGLNIETDLKSDVAPFWPVFGEIIRHDGMHAMKDITRGGLASALNEFAVKSSICIEIEEEAIPIKGETQAICDILGLEPMEISCEGRAIIAVDQPNCDSVLQLLRTTELGKDAEIVGTAKSEPANRVHVITNIGGTRLLAKPYGEPIPRVC